MATTAERRDNRRINLGPGHTIRFKVGGVSLKEVRIANISGSGIFAIVDQSEAHLFEMGTILEDLVLDHPMLPKGYIRAQVVYLLGNSPELPAMAFIGLGLHLLEMAPETQEALNHFAAASLGKRESD